MVKKKVTKKSKSGSKFSNVRKSSKKISKKKKFENLSSKKNFRDNLLERKFVLVIKNLISFGVLFLVSWFFYAILGPVAKVFFLFLMYVFGFVFIAFLITLFIVLFLKGIRSRN